MLTVNSDRPNESTFRVHVPANASSNKLLASLPMPDYQRIAPHLKKVPMPAKKVLYQQDAPIESVLFPTGGACSLVKTTERGHSAEIAVVGTEGVIGASVFFGMRESPCDVIVQMAGPDADVMPIDVFTEEMDRRGALHNRLIRYNQALMMQIMQTTMCNGLHSASERVARSLLTSHDKAGSDHFRFTHEFLASMLGVRRPTVTIVVGTLQSAGILEQGRGALTILDRPRLEAAACECYRAAQRTFTRLLPDVQGTALR